MCVFARPASGTQRRATGECAPSESEQWHVCSPSIEHVVFGTALLHVIHRLVSTTAAASDRKKHPQMGGSVRANDTPKTHLKRLAHAIKIVPIALFAYRPAPCYKGEHKNNHHRRC